MTMTREAYEAALVSDPFNIDSRLGYARLLLDAQDALAALTQFELVARQRPASIDVKACDCRFHGFPDTV